MRKSLFASSLVLTVYSAISILFSVIYALVLEAADIPEFVFSFLLYLFLGQFWWIAGLMAGVLGMLSLRWEKLQGGSVALGLLFGVRMAMELVSCLVYGIFDLDTLFALVRTALLVWFLVSALKAD